MKHRVDAVFDARAVGGEHGAFGGALPHEPGLLAGDPDFGQVAGAEQLRESERVDLVGFDFGGRRWLWCGADCSPRLSEPGAARMAATGQVLVVASTAHGGVRARDGFWRKLRARRGWPGSGNGGGCGRRRRGWTASTSFLWRSRPANVIIDEHSLQCAFAPLCERRERLQGERERTGHPMKIVGHQARVWAKRQLSIRARSSTGWTGGAATYDSGLKAHTCNRPAPGCSAPLSELRPICSAEPSGGPARTPCPKPGEH